MILFLFFLCLADFSQSIPSIVEYFPDVKNDLTQVIWAHAVNSRHHLRRALRNPKVMMLESDIVLGSLYGSNEIMPVLAHPPANKSELSLYSLLEALIKIQPLSRKGVKLDFKSVEAFEASFRILDTFYKKFSFPVFLNADILYGPVDSDIKPLNPDIFLLLVSKIFPKTVLSLGWTTKYGEEYLGNYSSKQLNNMYSLIEDHKIMQPVTLCFRAGLAAETNGIINLVERINRYQKNVNTTVTIWMSNHSDPVNIAKLKQLINDLDKDRVFLDVPHFIKYRLNYKPKPSKSPITAAQGAIVALLTSVSTVFSNLF